ncbi:MAG: hypothetical protein ACAI44_02050 [Candidatus Sericytochromatia bacterium]
MAQDPAKEAFIPGLIGNFNIPKAVIENKVDVLTFLELMVRKNIISAQELDEVRAAVVAHLNAAYPELELSYSTPEELAKQASAKPVSTAPAQVQTAQAPGAPPSFAPTAGAPQAEIKTEPQAANKPLWVQAAPPKFIK